MGRRFSRILTFCAVQFNHSAARCKRAVPLLALSARDTFAIAERRLDAAAQRFHSWGYWSNAFYDTRFLEIVWYPYP
jgi:hypothetical protein